MHEGGPDQLRPPRPPGTAYDERLVVPWWWCALGLGVALLGAAEIGGGAKGFGRGVLPYLLLPGLCLLALAGLSRGRLRVREGVLHVPGARIPAACVGTVTVLDAVGVRRLLGPLSRPGAFVALRPWFNTGVRLDLDDPADDTPYWLVGTRHPHELARAVHEAR